MTPSDIGNILAREGQEHVNITHEQALWVAREVAAAMNKYRAVRTVVDGRVFDSKREARRYEELKLLERAGLIRDLEIQPKFPLEVNGRRVATYRGDFQYWEGGEFIVEDCKGVRTPIYRLKAKLMFALYGIEIRET